MQSPHSRPRPQPWQTAHWLGQRHPEAPPAARPVDDVNHTASIYWQTMSAPSPDDPPLQRPIDAQALAAVWRRLGPQPQPPWLHTEVARRMAQRLQLIRLKPKRIVDWWSFLGAGAELLREAYPQAELIAVEPTDAMVLRSRDRLQRPWWSPQRWRGADAQVIAQAQAQVSGAQLVWANMVLHAVVDPPALLQRWHRALEPDGFVMFSCLGPDTVRELRQAYRRLGWGAPGIDFVDMHDFGDMLVHAGFADPVMDQETLTLQWDTPAALLAELRLLGGNLSPSRMAGLRTPRWRRRLEQALESLRSPGGRIGLSFEIAYGHAFKAQPRDASRDGLPAQTEVSLAQMRALVRSGRPRR